MIENEITEKATALFGVVDGIYDMLVRNGVSVFLASWLDEIISMTLLLMISYIADIVSRYIIHRIIERFAKFTESKWDDIFVQNNVFRYLVHIIPGIIFYLCTPIALRSAFWIAIFHKAALIFMVLQLLRAAKAATHSLTIIYNEHEDYANKPVKVFFQVIAVIIYFVGGLIILSILIGKSFTTLFAGLGASMAILMLVFKDTILGFVAGWQLSTNDMLRKGDWITVPKYGADGNVEEMSLYSVKVRNFDNTITTIPPYILVSDSFQNWRGMQESGGRRVKRSVSIDIGTVKFCTPEMLEKFRKIRYLTDYIDRTQASLESYNKQHNIDNSILVNGRRQTNIGVFRAYLQEYLKQHPEINHDMSCMVRQLQPNERGIPIELYFFTRIKDWEYYENVQSDIFDHVLAIVPQFELRIFQFPAGENYAYLISPDRES